MKWIQRIATTLLLLTFVYPLALSFSTSAEPQLPSCCRRDGKHRCATMSAYLTQKNETTHFSGSGEACPYRGSLSARTSETFAIVQHSLALFALHVEQLSIVAPPAVVFSHNIDSRFDRGPPANIPL